jgi:Zn-dependent peptidase ImmA (M78 family)/transcriptional regulator with XRE-family HTH domain
MKDRLTQFGAKCREYRARYSFKMGDQAKVLGLSVAYISAIERGKRPIPEDYPRKISEWMSLSEQDSLTLREIASGERAVVKVFPTNRERALLAEDFARDLNGLSAEAVDHLREVLRTAKRGGEYRDDEVRERAQLARAVFRLGEQISFDILRIIENQLSIVDPDFSLQVDPDGSLGEYLQIYSDTDRKTVRRFVSTEWLYNAAYRETEDSRYKLAHELAHWMLHRTQTHTFLRLHTNRNLSRVHAKAEREADIFAREFLMPLAVVEASKSAEALARAARVPLWAAQNRWREVSLLKSARRGEAGTRSTASVSEQAGPTLDRVISVLPAERQAATAQVSASILPFPSDRIPLRASHAKKAISKSLPLFDYAEAKQKNFSTQINRSDQWFLDFGWRG